MSFIKNIFEGAGDVVNSLTGQTGARAAQEAAALQAGAGREAITSLEEARATGIEAVTGAEERALGFLDPFSGVGVDIAQQGLDPSGLDFLTDPQAQFDFLQNNPLFQLSLENANRQTGARAASGGRLSAGDTLSQLSNNVLLSAQPLLDRQRQGVLNQRQDQFNQLGFGANIAGQQAQIPQTAAANIANISTGTGINIADLLTQIGASQAGGVVGGANARSGGIGNLINLGLAGALAFGGGGTTPQLQ